MENIGFFIRIILFKFILGPFLRLIIGIKYRYKEKLNFDKPKIIIANHNSHIDAIAILCGLEAKNLKRVHPVVARDYFYRNSMTKLLAKVFLNSVSVSRNKDFKNPLENCEKLLKKGHSLIIFPEGTRGSADEMKGFKHGVSILLNRHPEVEVVPAYCEGFGDIMPKGDWLVLPFNSSITFGKSSCLKEVLGNVSETTNEIKKLVLALRSMENS